MWSDHISRPQHDDHSNTPSYAASESITTSTIDDENVESVGKSPVSEPGTPLAEPSSTIRTLIDTLSWLAVFALALYVRLLPYSRVFVGNNVLLDSGDSYRHLRRILLSVKSFPSVVSFDNYNGFPNGMSVSWPPLWDFIPSALSIILGLGQPTEQLIWRISAVFPVLVGFLTFIPLAYLAKNIFGPKSVWPTLLIAAVFPPIFQPALLGNIDHHGGVVFFLAALLALTTWILKEGSEKLADKRSFLRVSMLLGITVAGSLLTWLGFVTFLGFFWLFFLVYALSSQGKARKIVESTAAGFLLAAAVLFPFSFANPQFTFMYLSFFQVGFLLGAGASLFAAEYIAQRYQSNRGLAIVTIGTIAAILSLLTWFFVPALRDVVIGGIIKTFSLYPLGQTTIEWKPLISSLAEINTLAVRDIYGGFFFVLPFAALLAVVWQDEQKRSTPAVWFFYIWGLISFVLAVRVLIFWQFLGITAVVSLGTGAVALWEILIGKAGLTRSFPIRIIPAGAPVAIALIVFSGIKINNDFGGHLPAEFHQLAGWIGANTPPTSGFYDLSKEPEYGILANWEYGDGIATVARRPVVANGNHETNLEGYVLSQSFFQGNDEQAAVKLLEENRIHYVIVGPTFFYFDGDLRLMGPPDSSSQGKVPDIKLLKDLAPVEAQRLIFSRLYRIRDANIKPLGNFRVLHVGSDGWNTVYVYEVVKGARVTGKSEPNKTVSATITLRTTNGSLIPLRYETITNGDGTFELVLPYATAGSMGDTSTTGGYTITDSHGTTNLKVDEQQVKSGETIDISL